MSEPTAEQLSKPTHVRFYVIAALCGLASMAYVHRLCVPALTKPIEKDVGIDHDTMGAVMGAFFLGYAFFQIPSGWLGARWGTRWALSLFVLLWSAAVGWMALTSALLGMCIAWFVNGVAQAGVFPCSVNSISKWFPAAGRAFPSGMLGAFMSVGAVMTLALTGFLHEDLQWGWRTIFLVLSVPGFLSAVWFLYWFRDRPAEHSSVNNAEVALIQSNGTIATDASAAAVGHSRRSSLPLAPLIKSRQTWLICGQQCCRAAGYGFFLTWFPTFLQEARGASLKTANLLSALPIAGVVLGSTLGGLTMDRIYRRTKSLKWSRQGIAVFGTLTCAALTLLAYYLPGKYLTTVVLTIGAICVGACGPAAYTSTIDLGGRHVTTLFSTMNMMGNFGAFAIARIVPKIEKWQSWNEVMLFVAGLYLLAACCWLLLDFDGSIFPEDKHVETSIEPEK